jgi:Uma2 family endonuclease
MPLAAHISPPPLREGDRLTSDEFIRRWEAMPELKYAELLDGIVYMPSPVSIHHADYLGPLATWLGFYAANTPGCRSGVDGTWRMGSKNVPQPDVALRILPEYGGQSRVEGKYAAGAPELIVEVAASSRAHDLGFKLKLYEQVGVREYVIALTASRQLRWKELTPDGYRPLEPDADGILRSSSFAGLWLDPNAFWSLDQTRVFEVLQRGLDSPEHAAFVAHLAGIHG